VRLVGHQLSRPTFDAISRGAASADVLRELTAVRRSRDLVLLRVMVDLTARRRHPAAVFVVEAFRRLVDLERAAPAAVAAVVHYPPVAAWLLRTVRDLESADPASWVGSVGGVGGPPAGSAGARPEFLAAVVAAAAVRGRVPIELDLTGAADAETQTRSAITAGRSVVTLPSVGTARLPAGPVRLRMTARGAELSGGGAVVGVPSSRDGRVGEHDRWTGVPLIAAEHRGQRVEFRLDSFDGFAGGGEFDQELLAGESRDRSAVAGWQDRLAQAWPLLVDHHGALAAEVAALLTVLAPMRPVSGGFAAATPRDAFGCVAMSRPRDATELALNLAHEIQHVKLTSITDLFTLGVDAGQRFYAPWRAEPRPLFGMLHGVYAHLGVTAFWRRQRHLLAGAAARHAHIQFARWRSAAAEAGRDLLASGRLTAIGTDFVSGVVDTLAAWHGDPVPSEAVAVADRLNGEHRAAWQCVYGRSSAEDAWQRL
jgi:HEXXH motif-containing protein